MDYNWQSCIKHGAPAHGKSTLRGLFKIAINVALTAHNWQNWKRVFLSCYCHENDKVEAIGLENDNYSYTWKLTIFVNMWNFGPFLEKSIFGQ